MTLASAIRIPFGMAVDCGLEGNCVARNVSRTGMFLEVPINDKSAKVLRGMQIKLLVAPLGSSPLATFEGTISRVETITLSDGSEGLGFGVQFKTLSEDLQSVIQKHIAKYIQEIKSTDDLREMGRAAYEQFNAKSLPTDDLYLPLKAYLAQLSTPAKNRIKSVLEKRFETTASWLVGQGYLWEIGIYVVVATTQRAENADKTTVMDRMKAQVASFQNELQADSNAVDIGDHAVRKELAEMSSRLTNSVKMASAALGSGIETPRTSEVASQAQYMSVFFDSEFFDLFLNQKTTADILDDSARNLIVAISQDWEKTVQERSGLSEPATALLKSLRLLSIKLSFESRQLLKTKPLAKNLPEILLNVKPSLAQFLEIQKQVKTIQDGSPADAKKEPLAALDRGIKYLTESVLEFQKFLSTLPVAPEAAAAYYKEPRLRAIVFDSKQAAKTRRAKSSKSISIPKPILFGALASLSVLFLFLHTNILWNIYYQLVPRSLGAELGVTNFTIMGDTFEGEVSEEVWHSLSQHDREQLGNKFAKSMINRGIPRVFFYGHGGRLLAKTMNLNGRRTWLVSQVTQMPTPVPTLAPPPPEPSTPPADPSSAPAQ